MSISGPLKRWIRQRMMSKSATAELTAPKDPTDKADMGDFLGRFREIVSDPINLLISRDPRAGMVEDGIVWLHNGNRVPANGDGAYYGNFSDILIINRGVHEPLEEYVFQELMRVIPDQPMMLELGAYWGHYSMWLKRMRPRSQVFLVEPNAKNLAAGQLNFARHAFEGTFVQAFVGKNHFEVDPFLAQRGYPRLTVLHCDIQGNEVEMLEGCSESFGRGLIDYVFISTHSQALHDKVIEDLIRASMRVEISSGFDVETTSFDGLVFASRPALPPIFTNLTPIGRRDILHSKPEMLVQYLTKVASRDTCNSAT